MPATAALPGNSIAAITAAGWILQTQQTPFSGASQTFNFAVNGDYKYLLLVWNVQGGSAVEFEIYGGTGIPEPASMGLIALAGMTLIARRRRVASV